MQKSGKYVVGLMSGTSLDGLDICLTWFGEGENFDWRLERAETISYSEEWLEQLKSAEKCSGAELIRLDREYGNYLGEQVNLFLKSIPAEQQPAFVSSHGHTIFHRPDLGFTYQLGSGASLAATCGISVVNDFRSQDVALGGQGAPLVPIGDRLIFGEYDYCLNLGGFANISFEQAGKRIAFDICAVNYVLNRLAQREGKLFDENGTLAAKGKNIPELLAQLNALSFYKKSPPKSLGREWVEEIIFPLLSANEKTEDLLRTFMEHSAEQISAVCASRGKMLVTGGGAHNGFLMELLREKCKAEIIVPDKKIVEFKEALIFALLGWLRWNGKTNVLAEVTGAKSDSCSGSIYQ